MYRGTAGTVAPAWTATTTTLAFQRLGLSHRRFCLLSVIYKQEGLRVRVLWRFGITDSPERSSGYRGATQNVLGAGSQGRMKLPTRTMCIGAPEVKGKVGQTWQPPSYRSKPWHRTVFWFCLSKRRMPHALSQRGRCASDPETALCAEARLLGTACVPVPS